MFGGSISRYFGKLHSLEGRCGAYFLPWFDSPLLEQCNCMQGSHWTSSTSVNVEWTCCCLSVFVGFTPLADAAAMASSPPSAGNSFGASADRWDGVKAFSGIAGFYQKNQELQRLLRNKNFKSKPESKFISLRHGLVNARAYFFHGLFLILHRALWFRIPSLRQSRGVHAALCPELLCWSFAFWKIPVSWRPVPGGKGFPVMLPEPWKEENNCLISFWKIKQPNKNNTELMNKSFFLNQQHSEK